MLQTKYGFEITYEVFQETIKRLTNQTWKLIPMKEHEEDWEKQLNTVVIEIAGLGEVICRKGEGQFLSLLSKLEGIGIKKDIEFELYRKTVFECISLLQGMKYANK